MDFEEICEVRLALQFPQDQAVRDDVVQRLLPLGESRHHVSDAKGNQASDHLRKITGTCARKCDSPPFEIRHHQPQGHLTERALVGGAFHPGVIDPHRYDRDCSEHQGYRDDFRGKEFVGIVNALDQVSEMSDTDQCKSEKKQEREYNPPENAVDQMGHDTQPKSRIGQRGEPGSA